LESDLPKGRALAVGLVDLQRERFDPLRGVRGAALVLTPLVIGYALGLVEAGVLVTLGALNLLFIEAPAPSGTRWHVLAVGSVTNAAAFAAGTLLGRAPFQVEAPMVGVAIFVAFLFTRWPEWENASFIGAVMFVFSVGIPVTTFAGETLRPLAILVGGLWALLGVSLYRYGSSTGTRAEAPSPTEPGARTGTKWATVGPHAAVVGVTVAIGLLVGTQLGLPRDYWIMLTIIVALRIDLATTIAYSAARILGTVAGASVAFVVTDATQDPWILFPILGVATALCLATRGVNYTLYSIWVTLTVIVLLNLAYSGGPTLAVTRVIDTILGGSIAFLAAFALWATTYRRPGNRSAVA